MERWALLYLLKIRHGSAFGQRGHALWRVLFVKALMPWLLKYRMSVAEEDVEEATNAERNNGSRQDFKRAMLSREFALQQELAEAHREIARLQKELADIED